MKDEVRSKKGLSYWVVCTSVLPLKAKPGDFVTRLILTIMYKQLTWLLLPPYSAGLSTPC